MKSGFPFGIETLNSMTAIAWIATKSWQRVAGEVLVPMMFHQPAARLYQPPHQTKSRGSGCGRTETNPERGHQPDFLHRENRTTGSRVGDSP
jgi:hypothetical protein